jgi:hypothetical protein
VGSEADGQPGASGEHTRGGEWPVPAVGMMEEQVRRTASCHSWRLAEGESALPSAPCAAVGPTGADAPEGGCVGWCWVWHV